MNFTNNIPIYMQIVEQIKIDIVSGTLKPGEKLLSVREFANTMSVNPNTMQKALIELEEMKLVYTERTTGKYVTINKNVIDKLKEEYAIHLSKEYLSNMKAIGLDKKDTIKYLKRLEDL